MSVKIVERRAESGSFFINVHKIILSDKTYIILAVYDLRKIFIEKCGMIHIRDGGFSTNPKCRKK